MGFGNREAVFNSTHAKPFTLPKVGSWLVDHDPEQYAVENYAKALASSTKGKDFANSNRPMAVEYRPWTIDRLVDGIEKGEKTILDGDWN